MSDREIVALRQKLLSTPRSPDYAQRRNLTLATHTEPDATIRDRVKSCFAELPEVAIHLGW